MGSQSVDPQSWHPRTPASSTGPRCTSSAVPLRRARPLRHSRGCLLLGCVTGGVTRGVHHGGCHRGVRRQGVGHWGVTRGVCRWWGGCIARGLGHGGGGRVARGCRFCGLQPPGEACGGRAGLGEDHGRVRSALSPWQESKTPCRLQSCPLTVPGRAATCSEAQLQCNV